MFVPTTLNPADCASIGISANEFIQNKQWWYGPNFLYCSSSSWPKNLLNLHTLDEERKNKVSINNSYNNINPEMLFKFSNFNTLVRVTSLCLRFIFNCKNPQSKATNTLSTFDTNN